MAKITTVKGRSGYYLLVPVPRSLRPPFKTAGIYRKAGKTKQEAIRNRPRLLMEVEQLFRDTAANDPVLNTFAMVDKADPLFQVVLDDNLREAGVSVEERNALYATQEQQEHAKALGSPLRPEADPRLVARLDAGLRGTSSYQVWIQRREKEELPAKSTVANWESRLRMLSDWAGTEYLAGLTKEQAVQYKALLLDRMTHQSVKINITSVKAFWNWGKVNGEVDVNIWDGLTKKLAPAKKKEAVPLDVLQKARDKAALKGDVRFFIQIYTGCRKGESGGLRYKDIDMKKRTIRFEEWEAYGRVRRLKGRSKDERTVPICNALYDLLMQHLPEVKTKSTDEWIWDDYRESVQNWSMSWASNFTRNYGFSSHNLRAYVVTQLMHSNISPYYLYEITRHAIPGLSDVVAGYVRPSLDELREVMEKLK